MGDEAVKKLGPRDFSRRSGNLPFALAGEIMRLNLMSAMAYRFSFLSQIVFMMLNNCFFLLFWWIFFSRFQDVQGWNLPDVVVLFAIVATSFGFGAVVFGNVFRLSTIIQDGQLDYYLSLPPDPFRHILISRMHVSGLGDIIFGILIFIFFVPFSWLKLILFFALSGISGLVFISFAVIAHSLSFFMGSSEGISRFLFESLLTFSMYPESMFSGMAKILLYTIIPAGFVGYIPASLLRDFSSTLFFGMIAFAAGISIFARWFFYFGLRRYESVNLIFQRQ